MYSLVVVVEYQCMIQSLPFLLNPTFVLYSQGVCQCGAKAVIQAGLKAWFYAVFRIDIRSKLAIATDTNSLILLSLGTVLATTGGSA